MSLGQDILMFTVGVVGIIVTAIRYKKTKDEWTARFLAEKFHPVADGYLLGGLNARMDHHLSSVWWCGAVAGFFLMNILRALV